MSQKKTIALLTALIILCSAPFAYRIYSLRPQNKFMTKEITAPVGDIGTAIDYVYKTVVTVKCGDVQGSGNIWRISPTYVDIITAGHVVDYEDSQDGTSAVVDNKDSQNASGAANTESAQPNAFSPCAITFHDGLVAEGRVIKYNEEKDIALIRVKRNDMKKASKEQGFEGENSFDYESVRLSKEAPLSHDDIFIMEAKTGTASVGTIESVDEFIPDFNMNMIYCLCDVDPGMSGSGLFDNKGHYLGILLGGSDEGCVCLGTDNISFRAK
ncbi:S1 family peptidase [Butyrivibrio sp. INlla21]|uniref:S1 family peptidase n=1 Tax=Butyrivibrio sp. INlla21 TaxID=1520811 RepID=UPI0008F13D30|nr:serine protease [Butyrivibrio sp. INlla21]SFU58802.1 Trypsin-like peptidase domain-containing protein [Butyrivibrio sp. INlla21]